MADGIRATPYRSSFAGSANDILGGLLGYMRDPRRTQQMQGLAGLLESTGIPKTVERLAYGEPLTNLQKANVPTLRPETAEALMTLLPVPSGASRAAKAVDPVVQKYGPKLEQSLLPAFEAAYNRGGLTREMVEAMGTGVQSPLTVYHGSPYKFNKFDSSKIGTGEGTAAYGRGLYVAQAPETARSYQAMANNPTARRQQKNRPEEVTLDAIIMTNAKQFAEGDVNKLADVIKRKPAAFSQPEKLLQRIEQYEDNRPPSFFYEIDLPDEQIAKMISYENPVPEDVRKRLSAAAMEKFGTGVTDTSGELLYKELTKQFKLSGSLNPEADASEFLRSQGIPGMSHLDAGSRTRTQGEGTQNFVVFPGNEDLLTILKRNGGLLD